MNIQQLFQDAKETILKNGDHAPMLTVENADGAITLLYFADLPDTTKEKQYMLFGCGRKHGKEHPGNPLLNLYFISEAWVSSIAKGEKRKYSAPSEDPERKEVIMIIHLNATNEKSVIMHQAEMQRSADGTLVDLLPLPSHEEEQVHDRLLPYFLAGFRSAAMSDAELAQHLTGQK